MIDVVVKSVSVVEWIAVPVDSDKPLVLMELELVGIAVPVATFHSFTVAVPASAMMSHETMVHAKGTVSIRYEVDPEERADPPGVPKSPPKLLVMVEPQAPLVPSSWTQLVDDVPMAEGTPLVYFRTPLSPAACVLAAGNLPPESSPAMPLFALIALTDRTPEPSEAITPAASAPGRVQK